MMIKQVIFIKFITILFAPIFFVMLHSSELQRDYTLGEKRVLSLFSEKHKENITDNVLLSLGEDNKLFVCYAGRKTVKKWYCLNGGGSLPKISSTTNILAEINPHEKIECIFEQVPEIDNEFPVTDIARSGNLYLVAHQRNIYLYHKIHTLMRHALQQHKQYTYPLIDNDSIKRIFFDEKNNIIAVSSLGAVYRHDTSSSEDPTCILAAFIQPKQIHTVAYNKAKNMLFFGMTGLMQMIALDSMATYTLKVAPNLSINTIDTCQSHIVLSDLIQNQNKEKLLQVGSFEGHLKKKGCCLERYTHEPCGTCLYPHWQWKKDKRTWEETEVTIELTGPREQLQQQLLSKIQYQEKEPLVECIHNIPNLPDSCLNTTVLLITFEDLFAQIMSCASPSIQNLQHQLVNHKVLKKEKYNECIINQMVTHLMLNDDSLFIGICSENATGNMQYGNSISVYPLSTIKLDAIKEIDHKYAYNSDGKYSNLLYCSSHRDSPGRNSHGSLWNLNFDHFDKLSPLHLVKNNETLCITKVACYHLKYRSPYLAQSLRDTILFTKTHSKKNNPNLLKIHFKRLNISFRKLLTLNNLYICFLLTSWIGLTGGVLFFLIKI